MALLVTGVTAVLLLIGALLLYAAHGTFSVPELAERVEPGPLLTVSGLLVSAAGLAKSAQVPLHFWLPRAMAAPTPVSAYLHSAAMVAAGVLLIGRVYPLLQKSEVLLDTLLVVGLLSMAVGGVLALTRDVLKQLLAYSTIAQYGFVVTMYGLGGPYGAGGAAYYVIAHAIAKSALFLTAGTVTEATGQDRLSKLGGLRVPMPLLAVASGLAGAALTPLPLTVGFFADEFFFAAALERSPLFVGLAVVSAATTLTYT
jgi:multicomponent Na+:H+ antiporter subunit A